MPRAPRQTAAGIYHVATRAPVGERLFRDEADFLRFEAELELAVVFAKCVCIAVCAMTTHYHLVVETIDDALPRFMHRLNSRLARALNSRYERRGHAFAERYMSKPVADDGQLLAAYRYVAQNPVEAGLCDAPGDWRWSSYSTLIGTSDRFAFADASIVLALCDGSLDVLRRFVERVEAVPGTGGAWHH